MGAAETFRYEVSEAIRAVALGLPEAEEGTSCVNRAFRAGGKNFAFLGEKDDECGLRLKLADGWTMLRFAPDAAPPIAELEAMVVESFRLLAPKRIVRLLDA